LEFRWVRGAEFILSLSQQQKEVDKAEVIFRSEILREEEEKEENKEKRRNPSLISILGLVPWNLGFPIKRLLKNPHKFKRVRLEMIELLIFRNEKGR